MLKQYRPKGFIGKVSSLYNTLCNFIKWCCLTATLLLIPISIGGIVYYAFVCYNLVRVLMFCIILWVMLDSNIKL